MLIEFENALKNEGLNDKTITGYLRNVEDFQNFLQERGYRISEVSDQEIRSYILLQKQAGVSSSLINRRNSSLRKYFKYLRKKGFMAINPMEDIKQLPIEKTNLDISEEQILLIEERILETKNWVRDLLIFRLMFQMKVKAEEMIGLTKDDFDISKGILYLGHRAVPLTPEVVDLVREIDSIQMFYSEKNKPLSASGIYFILKKHFTHAGTGSLRPIDLLKV